MKYFAYKDDGNFDGFYDDMIHGFIPKNNIKITEELWGELLKDNYRFKLNLVEDKILNLSNKEEYFEKVIIEFPNPTPKEPTPQDKFNAGLLKQNAQLLTELSAQKQLNSQVLLELAKLKGGNANV